MLLVVVSPGREMLSSFCGDVVIIVLHAFFLSVVGAFQQRPLDTLCNKFLAARDIRDKKQRELVELEAMLAFDIILEIMASVYLLEPFRPSEVGLSVLVCTFALAPCASLGGSVR